MHIFELLEKLGEILRAECPIDCLKNVILRKEIDTLQAKRVQSKQFKNANKSSGLSPKRLGVRIQKLLNFFLNFYPKFVFQVQHMSARELKLFLSKFRDSCFVDNMELFALFYQQNSIDLINFRIAF